MEVVEILYLIDSVLLQPMRRQSSHEASTVVDLSMLKGVGEVLVQVVEPLNHLQHVILPQHIFLLTVRVPKQFAVVIIPMTKALGEVIVEVVEPLHYLYLVVLGQDMCCLEWVDLLLRRTSHPEELCRTPHHHMRDGTAITVATGDSPLTQHARAPVVSGRRMMVVGDLEAHHHVHHRTHMTALEAMVSEIFNQSSIALVHI